MSRNSTVRRSWASASRAGLRAAPWALLARKCGPKFVPCTAASCRPVENASNISMASHASSAPVKSGSASTMRTPAASRVFRVAACTARISGSTGTPPQSSLQASVSSAARGAASAPNPDGSVTQDSGHRSSSPAVPDSASPASATVRAIGPSTPSGFQALPGRALGTVPGVGRSPTTPHIAAENRTLPALSKPSASATIPAATAAADPPALPPACRVGSHGLAAVPSISFEVRAPIPCSDVVVFPTMIAPAARSFPGSTPSRGAGPSPACAGCRARSAGPRRPPRP
ncbi:hypothetical protein BJF78_00785 [Pseudonocardia sp. CNS-139]|nr:hypothetical protein BJF78_00785 [Pseudonocardia sp. CNS-139]